MLLLMHKIANRSKTKEFNLFLIMVVNEFVSVKINRKLVNGLFYFGYLIAVVIY